MKTKRIVPEVIYCLRYCFLLTKDCMHNEVWGCAETLPNKDKRIPKTGYEGEENVNCWVVDGLWLKSIYQRRGAPSSVRFVSAIILQSFSFFLQNTYDRKRKYFVLRAPAQRWSLKLYFFQNNHMKTFSVAFTRLKCSEILSIVYKKNGEPFFLKPFFCLSCDLSKRGEKKTSADVNIL